MIEVEERKLRGYEVFFYEGIKYFLELKTNDVYDDDYNQKVGKMVGNKIIWADGGEMFESNYIVIHEQRRMNVPEGIPSEEGRDEYGGFDWRKYTEIVWQGVPYLYDVEEEMLYDEKMDKFARMYAGKTTPTDVDGWEMDEHKYRKKYNISGIPAVYLRWRDRQSGLGIRKRSI